MPYHVYILQNLNGRFYVGQTDDLDTRLDSHNRQDKINGKYTRKNGPWMRVWSESFPTRAQAVVRERQIKSIKSARWIRETLLNDRVPKPRD